ncbi:MAG TPA: DNA repair protein RecN [Ignavibacteriaceae bacterium]|jgi:DNA repair protein RecN (Recombination protein N)|nr:DNA repair protein RecN [Ignavibacteriaceae bacterium]HOJ18547.1 DNA repair protein RecN [Ignavibacteriaceae bacterium]
MLTFLLIKDYALIKSLEINFGTGLNIITGETGAGKSIIIDAMNLLLGERASVELIRKGADKSIIEGAFDISGNKKVKSLLLANNLELHQTLTVRRELYQKGNNRCFVNDSMVPLSLLKEFGNILVDLHGQHEHQSLLRSDTHIDYLDEFCNNEKLLEEYFNQYKLLQRKIEELNSLHKNMENIRLRKDFVSFQINEISAVNPQPNEDEQITKELSLLESSEKRLELAAQLADLLYDAEDSARDKLSKAKLISEELSGIDSALKVIAEELGNALTSVKESANSVRSYSASIEIDPEKLNEMRKRLSDIQLLKKKYGMSLSSLLDLYSKLNDELRLSENFEDDVTARKIEIEQIRKLAGEKAKLLTSARKKGAAKLEKSVLATLSELGIQNSVFKVEITGRKDGGADFIIVGNDNFGYTSKGIDDVEFYLSTNPGEDVKPLAKVASGGEVSRIMLALKTALAMNEKLPLLIFDEIDSGISGRIAQKVGAALKRLASSHQIISISHLPQIAAFREHHFLVEKMEDENRAVSSIRKLNEEDSIVEIAKLMGGDKITRANIRAAKELITASL